MYCRVSLIMPFNTIDMMGFRDDINIPDLSTYSSWKQPVARNPIEVSTCTWTGIAWFRRIGLSIAGPNSTHCSKRIALGNLHWLITLSSSWARKPLCLLNKFPPKPLRRIAFRLFHPIYMPLANRLNA